VPTVNSNRERTWDEVGVACVKSLSQGYFENPQPGQSVLTITSENELTGRELRNAGLHEWNIWHTHMFSCPSAQTPPHEDMTRNAGEAAHIPDLCSFTFRPRYPGCPWGLGGPKSRSWGGGREKSPYSCRIPVIGLFPGTLLTDYSGVYTHWHFIYHWSNIICWGDTVITYTITCIEW
jgi:hypothetical protein